MQPLRQKIAQKERVLFKSQIHPSTTKNEDRIKPLLQI